jgi:hypothetical protein
MSRCRGRRWCRCSRCGSCSVAVAVGVAVAVAVGAFEIMGQWQVPAPLPLPTKRAHSFCRYTRLSGSPPASSNKGTSVSPEVAEPSVLTV